MNVREQTVNAIRVLSAEAVSYTHLKNFFLCLLVGALLSLTIANLWEMFEYASYALFGIDMQEDMIINGFSSYFLNGTHSETVVIDGIVKTVIYLSDGNTYVIDGGYLDIGMYDTLNDMLVCLLGCFIFVVIQMCIRDRSISIPAFLRNKKYSNRSNISTRSRFLDI